MANGNGNGGRIEAVADSVVLRLGSRIAVMAIPFLIWFLFQEVWDGQKKLAALVGDVRRDVVEIRANLTATERRLDELGFRVDRAEMRRP